MHNIMLSWITGMSLGIEFYTGEDVVEGDKFAMTIDLFIVRLTYVLSEKED